MTPRLQHIADPLTWGFNLLGELRLFARGMRLIFYGFGLQVTSQFLMLTMFACLRFGAQRDVATRVFVIAVYAHLIGIALSFAGRRSCLRHSPAISGKWLLLASMIADVAAFLALLSPRFAPIPNLREAHFLPEAASIAFFLLFLRRLAHVIEVRWLEPHIWASLIVGGASVALHVSIFLSFPAAREAGPTMPLMLGDYLGILWGLAAI